MRRVCAIKSQVLRTQLTWDDGMGLRDTKPEVYEEVIKKRLLNTNFRPQVSSEDPEKPRNSFRLIPRSEGLVSLATAKTLAILMLLSKRFLQIISDRIVATPGRLKAFSGLDPQRIYVENVRALLGTTTWIARQICETAVRQGLFVKRIQILCPDGAAAATVDDEEELPAEVQCCREIDGESEPFTEPTARLDRLLFYQPVRPAA